MADLLKKDQKNLMADLSKLKSELVDIKTKARLRKASDDSSDSSKIKKQIARVNTALSQLAKVEAKKEDKK